MATGTSVSEMRSQLIFRQCWNLITTLGISDPCDGRERPTLLRRAANQPNPHQRARQSRAGDRWVQIGSNVRIAFSHSLLQVAEWFTAPVSKIAPDFCDFCPRETSALQLQMPLPRFAPTIRPARRISQPGLNSRPHSARGDIRPHLAAAGPHAGHRDMIEPEIAGHPNRGPGREHDVCRIGDGLRSMAQVGRFAGIQAKYLRGY
jgi:hypothetical protein